MSQTFQWNDPLRLDDQLTEEERMIKDAAHDYCQGQLLPRVTEAFRHEKTDIAIFREMGGLGLLGMTIPEQYGGAGLNYVAYGLVAREVERIDSGYRSMLSVQSSLVMLPINDFGSEAQKQKYLPKLATGELSSSFALTEPEAGSDAASLRTTAIKDGDHYVVNGTKRYITNAPHSKIFTLMARTNPADKGAGGVSAFIVDAQTPGISLGKNDMKMGQKGAHTCDVMFDNVRVPAANLIGNKEGQGFKTAMKVLEKGRIHLAAVCGSTKTFKSPVERHRAGSQGWKPALPQVPRLKHSP